LGGCDGVGRGGLSNETRSGGGCGAPISEPFGGRGVRNGTYPTLLIVCSTSCLHARVYEISVIRVQCFGAKCYGSCLVIGESTSW
jgi:uncharacterized membrane protein